MAVSAPIEFHFVYDATTGKWRASPPEASSESAPAHFGAWHCPLPGCGKENDAGVRVCWCCGNELEAKP